MARGSESLGWGGSGLHGEAASKLRKSINRMETITETVDEVLAEARKAQAEVDAAETRIAEEAARVTALEPRVTAVEGVADAAVTPAELETALAPVRTTADTAVTPAEMTTALDPLATDADLATVRTKLNQLIGRVEDLIDRYDAHVNNDAVHNRAAGVTGAPANEDIDSGTGGVATASSTPVDPLP